MLDARLALHILAPTNYWSMLACKGPQTLVFAIEQVQVTQRPFIQREEQINPAKVGRG